MSCVAKYCFWNLEGLAVSKYGGRLSTEKLLPMSSDEESIYLLLQYEKYTSEYKPNRFIRQLFNVVKYDLFVSTFFMCIYVGCQMSLPIHVFIIIRAIVGGSKDFILYLSLLGGTLVLSAISNSMQKRFAMEAGRKVRSTAANLLYVKSLYSLKEGALSELGHGKIINLINVDTQKLNEATQWVNVCWGSPLMILIALTVLFIRMGYSVSIGVAILVLILLASMATSKILQAIREPHMQTADLRVNLCKEVISGIRVIKLFGWEARFLEKIMVHRKQEMKYNRYAIMIWCSSSLINVFFPPLATLASIICYAKFVRPPSPELTFSAFAFFNIIKFPLMYYGQIVTIFAQANVSLHRIILYLELENDYQPWRTLTDDSDTIEELKTSHLKLANLGSISNHAPIPQNSLLSISNMNALYSIDYPCINDYESRYIETKSFVSCLSTFSGIAEGVPNIILSLDKLTCSYHNLDKQSIIKRVIEDMSFQLTRGSVTMVLGPYGCGKTSLLLAILGELVIDSGDITRNIRSISISSQEPFIVSGTLKENILFHAPEDPDRLLKVITMTCLVKDIKHFKNGLETYISESGKSLSGGQRSRITLARALYQKSELLLLDDVFSALDTGVTKQIGLNLFGNNYSSIMDDRTVLITTSSLGLLHHVDQIIVINDHKIAYNGNKLEFVSFMGNQILSDIKRSETNIEFSHNDENSNVSFNSNSTKRSISGTNTSEFYSMANTTTAVLSKQSLAATDINLTNSTNDFNYKLYTYLLEHETVCNTILPPKATPITPAITSTTSSSQLSTVQSAVTNDRFSQMTSTDNNSSVAESSVHPRYHVSGGSVIESKRATHLDGAQDTQAKFGPTVGSNIADPTVSIFRSYLRYIRSYGNPYLSLLIVGLPLIERAVGITGDFWLATMTGAVYARPTSGWGKFFYLPQITDSQTLDFYIFVLGLFYLASLICVSIKFIAVSWLGVIAARNLFKTVITSLVYKPLLFFDRNPSGYIIDRLVFDVEVMDNALIILIGSCLNPIIWVTAAILILSISIPYAAVIFASEIGFIVFVIWSYRRLSVQAQKLELENRPPLLNHLKTTLEGIVIIRAHEQSNEYLAKNQRLLDTTTRILSNQADFLCWMCLQIELLMAIMLTTTCLICFITRDTLNGGIVGLAVLWGLNLNNSVILLGNFTTQLELQMKSIEHLCDFLDDSATENPDVGEEDNRLTINSDIPHEWPTEGKIVFDHVSFRYASNLPLCLIDVTFTIAGKSRVTIVGRSGSGKSTLAIALSRLGEIESDGGIIRIDGVDLSQLKLPQIRGKAVCFIPQDPILFSGTLRSNLDPFDDYTDGELWASLACIRMDTVISGMELKLLSVIKENGSNFSIGQRQLLCLARALLRHPKILIMDETTASIDAETEEFIQNNINVMFPDSTIIEIAHRLQPAMCSDYVIVMSKGRVIECDKPCNLLKNKDSALLALVEASGPRSAKKMIALAGV